jgi:CheY-like chemotaxis protein
MVKTKKTILIIEDHADTQCVVSACMKKHHYETAFASDAVQAVGLARKIRPDAIILDLGLPGGNGFLVLQRLKAITGLADIPVIILTADDSPDSEQKGLAAGAMAFLNKPVQEKTLIPAVRCAVDEVAE